MMMTKYDIANSQQKVTNEKLIYRDEGVCKWVIDKPGMILADCDDTDWISLPGIVNPKDLDFIYCPYCGKKIEVE